MKIEDILELIPECKTYNISDSEKKYINVITSQRFYVSPELKEIDGSFKDSNYVLISAPGATGKTALAEYISRCKKALLWNTAAIQIGNGSFIGSLSKAMGLTLTNNFINDLAQGNTILILDAFDEAEIRSGSQNIELFINELNSVLEHEINSSKIRFILLSRTDTANNIKKYCNKLNCSLCHYEIGFFEEADARNFIKEKIKSETKRIEYDKKEKIIDECISEFFKKIKQIADNNDNSFLGYAPVLEAIAKHIEQPSNIKAMLEFMKDTNDCTSIIIGIMDYLLEREKTKFVTSLKSNLESKYPEYSRWDELYSPNEQLSLILNYISWQDLESSVINVDLVPSNMMDDYIKAIKSFLPQHPFLRNNASAGVGEYTGINFTGPAFRDYTLAKLLHSDDDADLASIYFDENGGHTSFPSQVFFDCYVHYSSSNIPTDHITYLYEAFVAKSTVCQHPSINVESYNNECNITFVTDNEDKPSASDCSQKLLVVGCKIIHFWRLQFANIDAQDYSIKIGRTNYETIVKNSSIIANKIIWVSPKNKVTFCADESECSIIAIHGFEGTLSNIQVNDPNNHFQICGDGLSGYSFNRLKKYIVDYKPDAVLSEQLSFAHAMSSILLEFKIDKKDTFAKTKDKVDYVLVGGSKLKKTVLDFLLAYNIIYVDSNESHLYKIRLDKLDEFGINFNSLRSNENMDKIYNAYSEYSNSQRE